jgi:hypothetical protein
MVVRGGTEEKIVARERRLHLGAQQRARPRRPLMDRGRE